MAAVHLPHDLWSVVFEHCWDLDGSTNENDVKREVKRALLCYCFVSKSFRRAFLMPRVWYVVAKQLLRIKPHCARMLPCHSQLLNLTSSKASFYSSFSLNDVLCLFNDGPYYVLDHVVDTHQVELLFRYCRVCSCIGNRLILVHHSCHTMSRCLSLYDVQERKMLCSFLKTRIYGNDSLLKYSPSRERVFLLSSDDDLENDSRTIMCYFGELQRHKSFFLTPSQIVKQEKLQAHEVYVSL